MYIIKISDISMESILRNQNEKNNATILFLDGIIMSSNNTQISIFLAVNYTFVYNMYSSTILSHYGILKVHSSQI